VLLIGIAHILHIAFAFANSVFDTALLGSYLYLIFIVLFVYSPASKRHMTEEYMTAHMSNLRISNRNEHQSQQFHNNVEFESSPNDVSSDSENDEALKQLFVCDEIKRFENEILPNAILCKL
jgi:hypothetical protein